MTVLTLSPISLAFFFFFIRWLCLWSSIRTELPHPSIPTSTQLPVSVPTDLLSHLLQMKCTSWAPTQGQSTHACLGFHLHPLTATQELCSCITLPPPPPASWILPFGSPTCRNFSLLKKTLPCCMTFSSPHPFFWPLMVTAPILSQPRAPLSVSWAHPHGWDCSGQGQKLAFLLPIQVSFSPYTSGSLGSNGCSCSSRNGFIQRFHAELTSWSFSSPVAPPSPSQSLHVEVHVHCMPSLI